MWRGWRRREQCSSSPFLQFYLTTKFNKLWPTIEKLIHLRERERDERASKSIQTAVHENGAKFGQDADRAVPSQRLAGPRVPYGSVRTVQGCSCVHQKVFTALHVEAMQLLRALPVVALC